MPKRNFIWIVGIISAAIVTMWVTRKTPRNGSLSPDDTADVAEAYRLIRENYYAPIDGRALRQGAVKGMVGSLDEFSTYVPPERVAAFESRMRGLECGLGLRVAKSGHVAEVLGAIFGSPAYKRGMRSGDRITSINGQDVAGLSAKQIEQLLAGPAGTQIAMTIVSPGAAQRTVTLTCRQFGLQSVQGLYRAENEQWTCLIDTSAGIAYLRVTELVNDTGSQFRRVFRQIPAVRALVLDLRDNPGGLLPAALDLADMFLSDGPIVTVASSGEALQQYESHAEGTLLDLPMVVLVNNSTASAAEIVAGALRCNDRAVLVGTCTRGKGCIQSMYKLAGGLGRVNLTTAEFFFGDGPQGGGEAACGMRGIEPHVQVTIQPAQMDAIRRGWIHAQLPLEAPPAERERLPADQVVDPVTARALRRDPQLARAVQLLQEPQRMERILARAARLRAAEKASSTPEGSAQP